MDSASRHGTSLKFHESLFGRDWLVSVGLIKILYGINLKRMSYMDSRCLKNES